MRFSFCTFALCLCAAFGQPLSAGEAPAADLKAALDAYVAAPTTEAFAKLHATAVGLPGYDPYGDLLDTVEEACTAKDWAKAATLLAAADASWHLSPTYHRFAALVATSQRDEKAAKAAAGRQAAILAGIIASGDGSADKPLLVICVGDEYAVLRHLRLGTRGQALVKQGDRSLDRIETSDGKALHFDVTAAFAALTKALQAPPPQEAPKP